MNNLPDVSNPWLFLLVSAIVFAVVVFRYFLLSGIFYGVFYIWKKKDWQLKKINQRDYKVGQFRKEITRSIITSIIFGLSGGLLLLQYQTGYAKIYENIKDYPVGWLPLSLLTALLLQEIYYYWLHRWMHIPSVFRLVHKWHHDSQIASPWTAFSFHPAEGIIQAAFLPLLLLFLPMHLYVLVFFLVIMSLSSVINHLDIEVYPEWFSKSWIGKSMIGATHHSMHHKQYRYNYGLYFTWLDRVFNTEAVEEKEPRDKIQETKKFQNISSK